MTHDQETGFSGLPVYVAAGSGMQRPAGRSSNASGLIFTGFNPGCLNPVFFGPAVHNSAGLNQDACRDLCYIHLHSDPLDHFYILPHDYRQTRSAGRPIFFTTFHDYWLCGHPGD